MKIDLEKAYDRIDWEFLRWVLMDLGLPSTLVSLIMFCVTSTEMNFLWNGQTTSYMKPSRGLRQGDPLSPYLFVLCLNKLSCLIEREVANGLWKPLTFSRGGPCLSHIFFADDLILMGEASKTQCEVMMACLNKFCSGMLPCDDLGLYLGVPLHNKRVTKHTYAHIVYKVKKKLASWKASNLSLAGRAMLVQSVTSSISTYTMKSAKLPALISKTIDSFFRNFLWGSTDEKRKVPLVKWDSVGL